MTIKDAINDATLFIGKPELSKLKPITESGANPTADQQADLDLLVRAFNLVYREISANYVPLLHKQKVTFSENKLGLDQLEKPLTQIKSLTNADGRRVKYQIYPTHIEAKTQDAEIVYAYLPENIAIDSNTPVYAGQILPEVIAYGMAREYFLIIGDYADSDLWASRYQGAIRLAIAQKRDKVLPARTYR